MTALARTDATLQPNYSVMRLGFEGVLQMNAKIRKLQSGTEKVWGVWIHLVAFALGIPLSFTLVEAVDRLQVSGLISKRPHVEETNFSLFVASNWPILLSIACVVWLLLMRFHVWPPIKKLIEIAPTSEDFWAHILTVGKRCWPYGLALSGVMCLFVLPLPDFLNLAPILLLFLSEHLIDRKRDGFINREVTDFLKT